MAKVKSPLTDKHLAALNQLLKACQETEEYCKTCEECNLDVDQERKDNAEQLAMARAIKAKFFPNSK